MGTEESSSPAGQEHLSPAGRLFHAPRFNCYIVAIMGCMKSINPNVVKAGLRQTLVKHPRFSSKLVWNYNSLRYFSLLLFLLKCLCLSTPPVVFFSNLSLIGYFSDISFVFFSNPSLIRYFSDISFPFNSWIRKRIFFLFSFSIVDSKALVW